MGLGVVVCPYCCSSAAPAWSLSVPAACGFPPMGCHPSANDLVLAPHRLALFKQESNMSPYHMSSSLSPPPAPLASLWPVCGDLLHVVFMVCKETACSTMDPLVAGSFCSLPGASPALLWHSPRGLQGPSQLLFAVFPFLPEVQTASIMAQLW